MRLALAVAFLSQALPNLAVESRSIVTSPPEASIHFLANYRDILSSDVNKKSKKKNVSGVKGVLRNKPDQRDREQIHETEKVDVGVLGSGYNEYAMEDLSFAINKAKQRYEHFGAPFISSAVCDLRSEGYNDYTCDCSIFNVEENKGSFACISAEDYCTDEGLCGPEVISTTIYDNGSLRSDHCYSFEDPFAKEVCYTLYHLMDDTGNRIEDCSIFVDQVQCNKCVIKENECYDFDCTNTAAGVFGNNCEGGEYVLSALLKEPELLAQVDPSNVFPPATACDKAHADYQLYDCDCSGFEIQQMRGSFSCTTKNDFCLMDGFCGSSNITNTITAEGQILTDYCYYLNEEHPMSVCYSSYGNEYGADSCAIQVDGIQCNSCEVVDGVMNNNGGIEDGCTKFDCTNTLAGIEGMDCLGDHIFDAILKTTPSKESSHSAMTSAPPAQQIMLLKSSVLASGFAFTTPSNSTVSRKAAAVY